MSFIKHKLSPMRFIFPSVITVLGLSIAVITPASAADAPTIYKASCAVCHDSGALNAPKKGDKAAWAIIKKKGMPALVNAVKNGMIQMPAGGLCTDCKDEDYRKLIEYMSQ